MIVLLPNQLFVHKINLKKSEKIYVWHHSKYFRKNFSDIKINFQKNLIKKYPKYNPRSIPKEAAKNGITFYNPVDKEIEVQMRKCAKAYKKKGLNCQILDNPMFILSKNDQREYLEKVKGKQMIMSNFYIWCRKKYGLLIEGKTKVLPSGGKWSYDHMNRDSFRKKDYDKYSSGQFKIRMSRRAAVGELKDFIKKRLATFGKYQDIIVTDKPIISHSALSYLLNVGLLLPGEILPIVLRAKIDISDKEAYVRQLFWREYMLLIYIRDSPMCPYVSLKHNFLKNTRPMPRAVYYGNTGILPVDHSIAYVRKHGWIHHIPRLMILANFMNMLDINPQDIYQWFMDMFIDSYDWVMYGNVISMGIFADGGRNTSRPYLCASNYILKMSNFKKEPTQNFHFKWPVVWDALYYRHIDRHKRKYAKMYSIAIHVKRWKGYTSAKKKKLLNIANTYLGQL